MGWSGPMTHRQYAAWIEWLELEWNQPSRDNYYALRIVAEIKRLFSKDAIDLGELKIQFGRPLTPQEMPPDDPNGPKRLRSKEDVAKAKEKIDKAMRMYQVGLLKP